MKKSTKTIIGVVVIILLIAGISFAAYEATKSEPVDIAEVNETANEGMEEANIINEVLENEVENTIVNEIANEVANEVAQNEVVQNTTTEQNDDENEEYVGSGSEVVTGTNATREERAVELAKEYYEETYGSTDGVYFNYDSVNSDGRYIVIAGAAGSSQNRFLFVNLNTEEVAEN